MSDFLDPNNEELLKDFFLEAQMQIEALESNILVLENDPNNRDAIDEIFRAAHTLKGGSATVQMMELSGFTHLVEDLLDEIRSDEIKVSGEVVDALLEAIDIIKAMLDARSAGEVFKEDVSRPTEKLKSFLPGAKRAETERSVISSVKKAVSAVKQAPAGITEYELLELKEAAGPEGSIYRVVVTFDEDNPMNTVGGIQIFAALKEKGKILKTIPDFELLYEDTFYPVVEYFIATGADGESIKKKAFISDVTKTVDVQEVIEERAPVKPVPLKPSEVPIAAGAEPQAVATAGQEEEPEDEESSKRREVYKTVAPVKGSVLRVDSRRIDNLLNLVSEGVINKATFNQISIQFVESLINLQNTGNFFKDRMKELFDSLPEYLESIHAGKSIKDIRKEILDNFGEIFTIFDPFEATFKNIVAKFRSTSQILGRITGEMHERVLQIRMVPISQIFSRFPRLVRDVSKSLNKQIKLIIEGEETELDKSVIEDLLDPLIHCVRNSVDHGVESPEERIRVGKPAEGHVLLKASNEGSMIIIEIADDGKGIDVEAVRQKAIERGIIHPNKSLSDIEAYNLIFEPGFSTAKTVTNISGRGVGLDVVKRQIDKLNGNVSVWSEKGKGTRMTIKLPLTLAIIQGLLVRVGKEVYAIPITSVLDSHRIKPSEIKMIDNYEVFNVREDVVSLIRLNRLFRIPTEENRDYRFIVIVGSGDKKMGLMVDALIGEEDVVIKPLKDKYTNSPGIAGATILGDGTVSLIIDVSQLLDLGLKREIEERRKREATIL
ncbi:MAG: chemotaxis protein CheA [Spirochaetota bacterium]